jgi:hypothetical protein
VEEALESSEVRLPRIMHVRSAERKKARLLIPC